MSDYRINGASMETPTSGNKYVDMYKKLQKFKDDFRAAVDVAASGQSTKPNSVFGSYDPTASSRL